MPARDIGDHSYFAYVTVSDATHLLEESTQRRLRKFGVRTVDGHRIMFGQELTANENDA